MPAPSQSQIASVRRFNRFYTREVGVLRKNFLETPWSLAEMRVLFEIANGRDVTASDIGKVLDLDAAYLSRMLQKFEKDGLLTRTRSAADARVSYLGLSAKGRRQFAAANQRQVQQTTGMLTRLNTLERERLVGAMQAIEGLLSPPDKERAYTLRQPKPGDLGWIVTLNAELYWKEYGWGPPFEALCARIVAEFEEHFDPKWERAWIAEVDGERAGCIMLVKDKPGEKSPKVARIRLLALDEKARGLGIGARLVGESVAFARKAGYKRVTLWTHSVLTAARAIYAKAGFTLSGSEDHDSWGRKVTSEFWDLEL
ncbi:MAG TPA: helix-turn-helix domain-containing GNAT family N-acetyltransferase [Hyphomonadaceae bacterium]|nr:helix-turn-helix domain-containing GNAT family N-acetyltransferase [Hyphomonadaceae bacterium]